MQFSQATRFYLKMFGGLFFVVLMIYYISKQKKFSCDNWANGFKDNFQCNIVLTDKKYGGGIATFSGKDITTGKSTVVEDGSKWLIDNFEKFKVGDTVIKKKGEYSIIIKRKDGDMIIPLICDNKIYKDK